MNIYNKFACHNTIFDLAGLFYFKARPLALIGCSDVLCFFSIIKTKNKPEVLYAVPTSLFFVSVQTDLLALMSVLSQSFFTLVRRHFMSFLFLSAWHS